MLAALAALLNTKEMRRDQPPAAAAAAAAAPAAPTVPTTPAVPLPPPLPQLLPPQQSPAACSRSSTPASIAATATCRLSPPYRARACDTQVCRVRR